MKTEVFAIRLPISKNAPEPFPKAVYVSRLGHDVGAAIGPQVRPVSAAYTYQTFPRTGDGVVAFLAAARDHGVEDDAIILACTFGIGNEDAEPSMMIDDPAFIIQTAKSKKASRAVYLRDRDGSFRKADGLILIGHDLPDVSPTAILKFPLTTVGAADFIVRADDYGLSDEAQTLVDYVLTVGTQRGDDNTETDCIGSDDDGLTFDAADELDQLYRRSLEIEIEERERGFPNLKSFEDYADNADLAVLDGINPRKRAN